MTSLPSSPTLDDDEFIWTSPPLEKTALTKQIQEYENSSLHCPICHQFFINCVTLRCPSNHAFCSECIRKALSEGNKMRRCHSCPICKKEVKGKEENYLCPNWGLQIAVDKYREMRDELYRGVLEGQGLKKQVETSNQNQSSSKDDIGLNGQQCNEQNTDSKQQQNKENQEHAGNARPRRSCRNNSPNYKEVEQADLPANKPVNNNDDLYKPDDDDDVNNSTEIESTNNLGVASSTNDTITSMNNSNDTSSSAATSLPKPTESNHNNVTNNMKRMPHFRFHGAKRSQLVRWCEENGLPVDGSDDDKKSRLKNYVILWNAECDSRNPRSQAELIKELKSRELSEKFASRIENSNCRIFIEKLKESRTEIGSQSGNNDDKNNNNGVSSTVTSGSIAFDSKLNNGFRNLIAQATDQKNGVKRKAGDYNLNFPMEQAKDTRANSSKPNVQPSVTDQNTAITSETTIASVKEVTTPTAMKLTTKRSINGLNLNSTSGSKKKKNKLSTPSGQKQYWDCTACTFKNEILAWSNTTQKCKVCFTLRVGNKKDNTNFVQIDC